MLRYLTYKLKSQSLNENSDSYQAKNDDDHDSGTESDDESADAEELEKYMDESGGQDAISACPSSDRASSTLETITDTTEGGRSSEDAERHHSPGAASCSSGKAMTLLESPLPPALDSALPSDSDHNFDDHHSSEEELEVINCAASTAVITSRCTTRSSAASKSKGCSATVPPRSSSSCAARLPQLQHPPVQYPEKRKWSQANRLSVSDTSCGDCCYSGSSDEEVRDLMCVSAPVEFRSSPPANVPKPSRSLSPPPKLFHHAPASSSSSSASSFLVHTIPPHELCSLASSSPRKRHRRNLLTSATTAHSNTTSTNSSRGLQRPCLDFEKMQQVVIRR